MVSTRPRKLCLIVRARNRSNIKHAQPRILANILNSWEPYIKLVIAPIASLNRISTIYIRLEQAESQTCQTILV